MHIAIIADAVDNQKAGIHTYTKNLIEGLIHFDKKNKYTFVHTEKNEFFKGQNEIIIKTKGWIYEFYRKFVLLPQEINRIKPDIVIEPAHFGPFRIKNPIKTITIIHDLTNYIKPEFHTFKTNLVHKTFLPLVIKKSDFLITPSENTKHDLKKIFGRTKNIFTLAPGIKEIKNKDNSPLIKGEYMLNIGTLEPRKNIEMLIDAFLELKKEKKISHRLVLAGKAGWKNKKILKKLKHKDIIWRSFVTEKEKSNLIKFADIFIYPSHYEGFGIPPVEALSLGIPTICSTGGSLKEIFSKITFMHDPKDKNALKKHILTLIKNSTEKENFKKTGPNFAQKFTIKKQTENFLKILKIIQKS
ncbi:MAG: glycosyltransferase family 1 protein [Candidatus Gracilibacteria bacterium]|jgi:glycosyltransferase involved in cell wall biosynthesis|nr:glycosyltransferase family 1 protein [Candidatus Gracilibacteria bacterium]